MTKTMTEAAFRISATSIQKRYGAIRALRSGQLKVRPGEIHALIGENGAGKSTMIKILSGAIQPNEGELAIDGVPYKPQSPVDALSAGVGTVYQDPQIVGAMTVAENIFLGRFPVTKAGRLDRTRMFDEAARILESLEVNLDPRASCQTLSIADQQLLQIARAASFQTLKFLILDEPTASLSPREVDHLFGLVDKLAARGTSVLFVSHKLEEVLAHCSAVTVFRDGEFIRVYERGEFTIDTLVQAMVGRELPPIERRVRPKGAASAISLRDVSGEGFEGVSFDVARGEIFGLFGLVGARRTDIVRAIFGAEPIRAGEMRLDGAPYAPKTIREAIAGGIAMVPEDRKGQGLVGNLSILENLNLATYAQRTRFGALNQREMLDLGEEFRTLLSIKAPDLYAPVSSLSGGNQQKVVLGRWMAAKPKVMILDEPAAGIDIGAKSEIYDLIDRIADKGTTVILVSSELPEILRLSHRVGVVREGRLVGIVERDDATEENLLALATMGQAAAKAEVMA